MSRWRCPGCGYVYDEQRGHPHEGLPAGKPWSEVPDGWACPDCGVCDKVDFEPALPAPSTAATASVAQVLVDGVRQRALRERA